MPSTRILGRAFRDDRIKQLAEAMDWSLRETLGCLALIWQRSQAALEEAITEEQLRSYADCQSKEEAIRLRRALETSSLIENIEGGRIRIRGQRPQLERIKSQPTLFDVPRETKPKPKKKPRSKKPVNPEVEERRELARKVWETYRAGFLQRYRIEPLRNAKVNSQIVALIRDVGKEHVVNLVGFYLRHNDAFFIRAHHPMGVCLNSAQRLIAEMLTGQRTNFAAARRAEAQQDTEDAIRGYLNDLEGGRTT